MKLHIIDISPYIYAGSVNKYANIEGGVAKTSNGFVNQQIPSGGISFLFNLIVSFDKDDDWVFVGDRPPTEKRKIDVDYKMNRSTSNKKIQIQKEIIELILENCGFQIYTKEGYEADDLIYSLTQRYKDVYEKVYIYTGDRDLAVAIDTNVEIMPCTSKNRRITLHNYETEIDKGMMTPFCTFSFNKMLNGDPKDNIKKLPNKVADRLLRIFPKHYYENMGSVRFFGELLKAVAPEAYPTFQLVYPLLTPVDDITTPEYDLLRITHWGYIVGNSKFRYDPLLQVDTPKDIIDLRNSFFTGEYYSRL